MSDFTTRNTTHSESTGKTGLVVAAVLIGLFVLVLAMLGTATAPEGEGTVPAVTLEEVPVAPTTSD